MNCFDSTFVIDYLAGESRTIEYLEPRSTTSLYVPAIVFHEALEGQVKSVGPPEFHELRSSLTWADIAPFDESTAREAATIQSELAEHGRTLKTADAMIAGTARDLGATLVTRDDDLTNDAVRAVLDVETY